MIDLKLIEKNIKELLENLNYKLMKFSYTNGKDGNILHIEIDNDDAISMDDIVKVSNNISALLDEIDTSSDSYLLDVSSSGIEKPIPLDTLKDNLNGYVNIHLIDPYKGENYLEGKIIETDDESITLEFFIKGARKKVKVLIKNIDKARKAIKF